MLFIVSATQSQFVVSQRLQVKGCDRAARCSRIRLGGRSLAAPTAFVNGVYESVGTVDGREAYQQVSAEVSHTLTPYIYYNQQAKIWTISGTAPANGSLTSDLVMYSILYTAIFSVTDPTVDQWSFADGLDPNVYVQCLALETPVTYDAEQAANGSLVVVSDSLDLDIGRDAVGLVFTDVNLAHRSNITSAYLEFTIEEASLTPTQISLAFQAGSNVHNFATGSTNDILGRVSERGSTCTFSIASHRH